MGEVTTRNMYSSFPEINKLCIVASLWKYIKRNTLYRFYCCIISQIPKIRVFLLFCGYKLLLNVCSHTVLQYSTKCG